MVMRKQRFKARVIEATAPLSDMEDVAIRSDKGIPIKSPDGSVWLVRVNDTGALYSTKIV